MQRFADVCSIGRRAAKDCCTEIAHKLDLALGIARGHRQRQTSCLVRAAVQSHTAGEQTVAVCDLTDIILIAACRGNGSGTAVLPEINVMLGIESNNALAGRTAGRVDSDAVRERLCEQPEGICLAQIGFREKRQLVQIVNRLDVLRFYAFFVHEIFVVGDVFVDMLYLLDEALILELLHVFARHCFNVRLPILCHWGSFLSNIMISVCF